MKEKREAAGNAARRIMIMKEMPVSERPYEKCLSNGPGVLSDAELLAVILRTGAKGITALELAVQLLSHYENQGGLAAFFHTSTAELMGFEGIGEVKAIQLQCIGELSRRISRIRVSPEFHAGSAESVAQFFMEDMRHLETEEVLAAFLNTRGGLISSRVISRGTVNMSLISPREVFIEALRQQAVRMVLLHNHPSGDPNPSEEDYRLTERLYQCGHLMGIPLQDHIVIGDNCYVSFRESGLFQLFPPAPAGGIPLETDQ